MSNEKNKHENFNCDSFGNRDVETKFFRNNNAFYQKYNIADSFVQNAESDYYGIVYIIIDTNKDGYWNNEMVYIGQTIQDLKIRFQQHLRDSNFLLNVSFKRYNKEFSIIKINSEHYTTDNREFEIIIIHKVKVLSELNLLEMDEIKKHKSCFLDFFGINDFGIAYPLYGFNISRGGGGKVQLYGVLNPAYVYINKDQLKDMISKGFLMSEMERELGIKSQTILKRVYEFWNYYSLMAAREAFGGLDIFRSKRQKYYNSMSEKYRSNMKLQKLLELVSNGYMVHELIRELGISLRTLYNWLNILGYDNLRSAYEDLDAYELHKERENAFRDASRARGEAIPSYIKVTEEDLLPFIKNGFSIPEIIDELNKRGIYIADNTLSRKIKELFGLSIKDLRKIFILYPKIDNFLKNIYIDDLLKNNFSIKDIDLFYIRLLVSKGFKFSDIANLYGVKQTCSIGYWLRKYETSIQELIDNFYFKPRIIDFFRTGSTSIEEIARYFPNYSSKSVNSAISRIWNIEYINFNQDMKKLLKFLQNEYSSKNF